MSWVKLSDTFAEDPRLEAAGADAFVLHVAALCYCMRNLTDGRITAAKARLLWPIKNPSAAIEALVREGFWKPHEGGYEIVDFASDQRSAADVRQDQVNKKAAQKRWRDKKRDNLPSISGDSGGDNLPSISGDSGGESARRRERPAQPSPAQKEAGLGPSSSAAALCATCGRREDQCRDVASKIGDPHTFTARSPS